MLVELLEVLLEGTKAQTVGRGAFSTDGGTPRLIEGNDSCLRGEVRPSDVSFQGVNIKGGRGGVPSTARGRSQVPTMA